MYLKEFEKNKISIINIWLNSQKFINIISEFGLDSEIIRRRYAFAVIDFYIKFSLDDRIEVSSGVLDFLKYLKKYKIQTFELFNIYSSFKNALLISCKEFDIKTINNIEVIEEDFEKMFFQILRIYSKSIEDIERVLNKSIDIVDRCVLMSRCDKNGVITSLSSAFCELFGYEPYELIGKELFVLQDDCSNIDELKDAIKNGKEWIGNTKNIAKDGTYYYLETSLYPNYDKLGELIGFDTINQNITSQIKLEQNQKILLQQSKSAAMGEMISMIAHQWRQPLQIISVLVQKLSFNMELNNNIEKEIVENVVEQVRGQLDYMSKTIDDFRDFFKPTKKTEEVYIDDVIKNSIEFLTYSFEINSINIDFKNSSKSKIEIYFNEIVQVLINIFKNSIDAMIERDIENRFINITSYEKNDYLYVVVEDNAGGIDKSIIDNIFDPYFSTKSEKNGTGIGLYMSKNIIQKHSNGEIYAKNIDNGLKTVIKLPLNRR